MRMLAFETQNDSLIKEAIDPRLSALHPFIHRIRLRLLHSYTISTPSLIDHGGLYGMFWKHLRSLLRKVEGVASIQFRHRKGDIVASQPQAGEKREREVRSSWARDEDIHGPDADDQEEVCVDENADEDMERAMKKQKRDHLE